MKAPLVLLPLLLLGTAPLEHGPIYSGMPPERYQGDSIGIVAYVTDLETYCGPPTPGTVMLGCHRVIEGTSVQFLRNPCQFGETNWYARIACHESAHSAGWTGRHEL